MRYPVVNTRALGRGDLFGGSGMAAPTQAPMPAPRGRVLGMSASTQAAAERLKKAQDLFGRVQHSYSNLVTATGEDSAKEAYDQASQNLEEARQAYDLALKAAEGSAS